MASPTNYIAAENPFNLAPPPDWWLRKLHEIDPALRIFPGLTQACFRVGRRTPNAAMLKPIALESETNRMMKAGCIPVVSLVPRVHWNDDFFQWLKDHDTWTEAGPTIDDKLEKHVDAIERNERAIEEKKDRDEASDLDARSTSAYFAQLVRRRSLAFVRGYQGSST